MTTSGWYLSMIAGKSVAHAGSVLRPHPPNALSATTWTCPVASRAAATPGALSAITLSPRIHVRRGSAEVTTRPAGSVTGGALYAGRVAGERSTLPVDAPTGGIVDTSTTPTTPKTPDGTSARRHHRLQSTCRAGRSMAT